MFDPVFIASVRDLGTVGFLLIGIGALALGIVRVGKLVDKAAEDEAERRDNRESELVTERNEWRSMAETSVAKLGRLTDVLEATVGKRLGE